MSKGTSSDLTQHQKTYKVKKENKNVSLQEEQNNNWSCWSITLNQI